MDTLRVAVEKVIDDLIESANGLTLDEAWCRATVDALIAARDGFDAKACECVRAPYERALVPPPQGCLVHGRAKDDDRPSSLLARINRIEARLGRIVDHEGFTFDPKGMVEILERLQKDSHPPMPLTIDGSPLAGLLDTFKAQIASLQHAVAAIERRQSPLLQHPPARDPRLANCLVALHELARDCDAAATKIDKLADAWDQVEDPAFLVSHKELRDLSVSLGDASALASKTARESA